MPNANSPRSTVRRTLIGPQRIAEVLVVLNNACTAGAQCPAVQNAVGAKQALANLTTAVVAAAAAHASRLSFLSLLATEAQALRLGIAGCAGALRTYESAVNALAAGNASIIHKAGLPSRAQKIPPSPLGEIGSVKQKPGKLLATAILSWPKVARATGYAIQVNPTPATPSGPWTALSSGSSRRRVVSGPGPGSQILVQIAALAGNGAQSAWSAPILVTTR
jgi:hypothetical protein